MSRICLKKVFHSIVERLQTTILRIQTTILRLQTTILRLQTTILRLQTTILYFKSWLDLISFFTRFFRYILKIRIKSRKPSYLFFSITFSFWFLVINPLYLCLYFDICKIIPLTFKSNLCSNFPTFVLKRM